MDIGLGIVDSIVNELSVELADEPMFKADILRYKVMDAMREIAMKRNYIDSSYTPSQIESDLKNYYSIIKKVALYDYNHIGAEGEQSHGENSVNRSWINRDDLFKGVHAFVKVI